MLGIPHPRILSEQLTSREITDWIAYEMVEPFGEYRADLRAGIVAATVANVHRPKGRRAFKPEEFMPNFGERKQQQSVADMHMIFREFAAAHNAALEAQQTKEGTSP